MVKEPEMLKIHDKALLLIFVAVILAIVSSQGCHLGNENVSKSLDDSIEYMWANPPMCIKNLHAVANPELKKTLLTEYGYHSTVFGIKCGCGKKLFSIEGQVINKAYHGVAGSINVVCSSCRQKTLLFDPMKHGYEGAVGEARYTDYSSFPVKKLTCPKCGKSEFEVAVLFQYSGDEAENIKEANIKVRPEDLFGWISAQCKCGGCGTKFEMTSIECQ